MRNIFTVFGLAIMTVARSSAHCDSIDGPVVKAAREALASGDVNLVMPWIQPKDEDVIRQSFIRTLAVRKLNPDAERLADTWFFETLVRIHRAGEGASYDGLKPTGYALSPAITAADQAIEKDSDVSLTKMLTAAVQEGVNQRFHRVLEAKRYKPSDVNGGREYVAAYVRFIHFVEGLHMAVATPVEHVAHDAH